MTESELAELGKFVIAQLQNDLLADELLEAIERKVANRNLRATARGEQIDVAGFVRDEYAAVNRVEGGSWIPGYLWAPESKG